MFFALVWLLSGSRMSALGSSVVLVLALTEATVEMVCAIIKASESFKRLATLKKIQKVIRNSSHCVDRVSGLFANTAVKSGSCWMGGKAKLSCPLLDKGMACKDCWTAFVASMCNKPTLKKESCKQDE